MFTFIRMLSNCAQAPEVEINSTVCRLHNSTLLCLIAINYAPFNEYKFLYKVNKVHHRIPNSVNFIQRNVMYGSGLTHS